MNDDEFKELVFDLDEELLISQKLELARKLLFSISKDNTSKEVAGKALFAFELLRQNCKTAPSWSIPAWIQQWQEVII